MPNRIIRDGILRSEKVNALEPLTELFYRRLMSVVDDYGRTEAHPTLLRSSCYPLLIDKVDEESVKKHIKSCQEVGLVQSYTVEGKHYIQLINFNQQVRAKVSKFPSPTDSTRAAHAQQMPSKCIADATQHNKGGDGDDFSQHWQSKSHQVTAKRPSKNKTCVADAKQMISYAHLDGDGDGDGDGGECVDGARQVANHSLAEVPTIDEVKAFAVTIGLVEWKAVDWFHKQEAVGWRMNNQRIRKWQPLMTRLRTFWESDGKPLKPPGKASSTPLNGAAMPPWARIKTIEEGLSKHPGNRESVYSSGKQSDRDAFKALKIKLRELKAEQEKEAIA